MSEGDYRGGSTVGGRWGCIASVILGVPVFLFLLIVDAMGDCVPDTACRKGFLTQVLLPSMIVALCVGLLVRWAVGAARDADRQRRGEDDPP
ncbi:MAG: hypothetical protein COC10_01565 [Sphingobium sp.]|nr:MAG: hypothetical protein COC10_01565 [Sphingobium sp.]